MDYQNNGIEEIKTSSLKDRILIVRYYLFQVVFIIVVTLVAVLAYAYYTENIYSASAQIKITKPKGNILETPLISQEFTGSSNDRFITTEILFLKSRNFRMRVSATLIDSFQRYNSPEMFNKLLVEPPKKAKHPLRIESREDIAARLASLVIIEQIRNVDVIQITVESPSAFEAALIANCYLRNYQMTSIEVNRNQLTLTKNFLLTQKNEKLASLNQADNDVRNFQEKVGFVSLDNQASTVINQISDIEAKINLAKIDLVTSNNILTKYKDEIKKSDPKIAQYIENSASSEYLKAAQAELAKLQLLQDMAQIDKATTYYDPRVEKESENKIKELKSKIALSAAQLKDNLTGQGVDEIKGLYQRTLDEEIKNQSLKITIAELDKIFKFYENKFNALPRSSIEFAGLKRKQESIEKLYTLVEGRYQEALINEQSQPGYVTIIDDAAIPSSPSKPNRPLIILVGLASGFLLAVGSAFVRNYFDDTIKSPDELEKRNINLLGWIPPIEGSGIGDDNLEFVVQRFPKAVSSEAFRVLRTRIQFSKLKDQNIKSILITSSIPSEGKTTVAANLAGSFAQSDFKTIIVDCDFRKPRIHSFFVGSRTPGLVDFLFGKVSLEEITYKTEMNNLFYIPCGTIPPNPAEILQSAKIKEFFLMIHEMYDFIIVDSPPVIAVTDAELISQVVDVSIIVAMADYTKMSIFEKVVKQFESNTSGYAGVVLNNFKYTGSYGSYYKYYYYYYGHSNTNKKKTADRLKNAIKDIKK